MSEGHVALVISFPNPENFEKIRENMQKIVDAAKVLLEGVPDVKVQPAIHEEAAEVLAVFGVEERQSNLVDHAERELFLLGEDPETVKGLLKVIRAFSNMGHSGGSASICIPMINDLLNYKNLTPLTDDPPEWIQHSDDVAGIEGGVWQSARNPEAFSLDKGKHYYLLSEGGTINNPSELHATVRTDPDDIPDDEPDEETT